MISSVESTQEQKGYYAKWERLNSLSLIAIKRIISDHLLSGLPNTDNAKELITALGQRYLVSNNVESRNYMKELTTMTYDNTGGVKEYIMKMLHLQAKLKALKNYIKDDFLFMLP